MFLTHPSLLPAAWWEEAEGVVSMAGPAAEALSRWHFSHRHIRPCPILTPCNPAAPPATFELWRVRNRWNERDENTRRSVKASYKLWHPRSDNLSRGWSVSGPRRRRPKASSWECCSEALARSTDLFGSRFVFFLSICWRLCFFSSLSVQCGSVRKSLVD